MAQLQAIIKINEEIPKVDRVRDLSLLINKAIREFESLQSKDGVEAFQENLMDKIREQGLCDMEWHKPEAIAVHPDNREKSMLVPIDAHTLLLRISFDGWAWSKANVVASRIPEGHVGDEWKTKNVKLAVSSDGLLPPYNPDLLKIATARGSHTSAAVRIMKLGARNVFDALGVDGKNSQSKIIERQRSMIQPIEKRPAR